MRNPKADRDHRGLFHMPGQSRAVQAVPAEVMLRPESLDVRFEGFGSDAFDVLEQLRRHPHINEYRKQKTRIRTYIQEPFKRYRDDLVVNWLLPNRIGLETEKNVFSRLLKNDFGAGGCHHHFWMSFYRPERRRLKDVQLAHSLWPEALYIVVYVGNPVPELFKRVRRRILRDPRAFFAVVNPLLQNQTATVHINYGKTSASRIITEPLVHLPDDFGRAQEVAVRISISRDEVIAQGPRLIGLVIESITKLWPSYRFCLESSMTDG